MRSEVITSKIQVILNALWMLHVIEQKSCKPLPSTKTDIILGFPILLGCRTRLGVGTMTFSHETILATGSRYGHD